MKKLLVLILATIISVMSVAIVAEAASFTDVKESDWYYKAVESAFEMGLINGKGVGTYKPLENMTYAEAVKLAACMHQRYTTGSVTLGNGTVNWYDTYVEYCKNNGIISKDYEYNKDATRAGYMEIFANALPASALEAINNVPDDFIPDVKMTESYAPAVYKLYRAGIVGGVDAKFNCAPDKSIQRYEVAVILTRMMVKENRVAVGLPKEELSAGTLTPEDEKIYNSNKSAMERLAKDLAETAAMETVGNSYSYTVNSKKVTKSDSYFRYVISMSITNTSVSGTDELYFEVLIRAATDYENHEVYMVSSSKITEDHMRAAGWGTRPEGFGAEPEE